jgi:hypothetical protein
MSSGKAYDDDQGGCEQCRSEGKVLCVCVHVCMYVYMCGGRACVMIREVASSAGVRRRRCMYVCMCVCMGVCML